MNATSTSRRLKRSLKPVVIALALALPGSAALAASMGDIVTTRADQNIDRQYGRDSVYAFSPDKKPLTPERTSGSSTAGVGSQPSQQSVASEQQSLASNESQSEAIPAGSGYADTEIANVGTGYTGSEWRTGYMVILPVEMAFDSEDDGIADSEAVVEDGTTHEFDRGYYKDPDQVAMVVVVPSNLDAIEQQDVSDDDTAQQFDRGYYQDPEQTTALVIIPEDDDSAASDEPITSVLAD